MNPRSHPHHVRKSYGPTFVRKHEDAFRRYSLCDLPPHKPATPRPRRGQFWKIPPCWDRKRLRSSVPRHLVRMADCYQVFPKNLLRRLRYGALRPTKKTRRDDPKKITCPRRHCIGVELSATGANMPHKNLPAAENCNTRPRCILRRLAPPAPSTSFKQKPALPTGAMVHAITIQRRLPRLRRRR